MSLFYLPGCKFSKYDPTASDKLAFFCESHLDAQVLGCCSIDFSTPKPGDTVLYLCPTCALIMKESNPSVKLKSIYEAILEYDELLKRKVGRTNEVSNNTFNNAAITVVQTKSSIRWIDLEKKAITIQDCWRSREDPNLQLALRKVLSKMNASIVELENNFDKTDFCGLSLLKEPSPRYEWLAPKLFSDPIFKSREKDQQINLLTQHVSQYKTKTIACYCTGCIEGIEEVTECSMPLSSTFEQARTTPHKIRAVHMASLLAQCI